ncbi:hypothetical protein BDZ97DRAFT_566160 [Flammula alnicola]|nr:hypothetical protein BDZ97DRAFT_566160 [Flammula alnicola]
MMMVYAMLPLAPPCPRHRCLQVRLAFRDSMILPPTSLSPPLRALPPRCLPPPSSIVPHVSGASFPRRPPITSSMSQVSNWMINARRRILAPAHRAASGPTTTAPFPPSGRSASLSGLLDPIGRRASMPAAEALQLYHPMTLQSMPNSPSGHHHHSSDYIGGPSRHMLGMSSRSSPRCRTTPSRRIARTSRLGSRACTLPSSQARARRASSSSILTTAHPTLARGRVRATRRLSDASPSFIHLHIHVHHCLYTKVTVNDGRYHNCFLTVSCSLFIYLLAPPIPLYNSRLTD